MGYLKKGGKGRKGGKEGRKAGRGREGGKEGRKEEMEERKERT